MTSEISTNFLPVENARNSAGSTLPLIPADASEKALRWTLHAELEDTLALLRSAVLLARSWRTSLRLAVSPAPGAGQHRGEFGVEIHFGTEPCNALVSALLESVERRLRRMPGEEKGSHLIQIELRLDTRPIAIHISAAESRQ